MQNKENISIKFGQRLRILRIQKGFSQEQLAHHAAFPRSYIGMIECAEKNITIVSVEKLAKALNVSIKDFFDDEN